ncbi:MAG: imidazole glycerol phosphate synthase subunit HisH [Betaproteobacteria bacterium]|nr:imidazole glycerol phosphate synthase subunit HisH [Betaproteobacteria bacterium]
MNTIAVIDYGMGNLRSVSKALEHVAPQCRVVVTSEAAAIAAAERVVFPGQGAMPDCMRELDSRGLRAAVIDAARRKPFLGICIGLQMLFEASEEGDVAGLALFRGKVVRFPAAAMKDADGARLKVPHMGWNEVRQECAHPGVRQERAHAIVGEERAHPMVGQERAHPEVRQERAHPLWQSIPDGCRFYFVHSYYPRPDDTGVVAATTCYPFRFTCAVARDNIFAVQFHPEKSQAAGLALLRNFAAWDGTVPARSASTSTSTSA